MTAYGIHILTFPLHCTCYFPRVQREMLHGIISLYNMNLHVWIVLAPKTTFSFITFLLWSDVDSRPLAPFSVIHCSETSSSKSHLFTPHVAFFFHRKPGWTPLEKLDKGKIQVSFPHAVRKAAVYWIFLFHLSFILLLIVSGKDQYFSDMWIFSLIHFLRWRGCSDQQY